LTSNTVFKGNSLYYEGKISHVGELFVFKENEYKKKAFFDAVSLKKSQILT